MAPVSISYLYNFLYISIMASYFRTYLQMDNVSFSTLHNITSELFHSTDKHEQNVKQQKLVQKKKSQ